MFSLEIPSDNCFIYDKILKYIQDFKELELVRAVSDKKGFIGYVCKKR